jgi:hypothetical protein
MVDLVGSYWGVGSVALDWRSSTSARLRACVEAVLTWELVRAQYVSLEEKKLDRIYTGTVYRSTGSSAFRFYTGTVYRSTGSSAFRLLVLKHS